MNCITSCWRGSCWATRAARSSSGSQDYVRFYLEHMATEEKKLLPAAEESLNAQDWSALDAAFAADRDPLAGGVRDPHYDRLFTRIVKTAPARSASGSLEATADSH